MYTKDQIKTDLKKIGIKSTDTLFVHSSVKAVGEMEDGAQGLLDALIEYLDEGLLVLPAHTWLQIRENNPIFDPLTEKPCVGILPYLLMQRSQSVRSLHPTHSVVAIGHGAEEFTAGAEKFDTPCAPTSWWGKLGEANGKVLLLGCLHNRNTFIHGIEEFCDVPNRLTVSKEALKVKVKEGLIDSPQHRHYGSTSEKYLKLHEPFLKHGIARAGKIGDADSLLCGTQEMTSFVAKLLEKDRDLFGNHEPVPLEWY